MTPHDWFRQMEMRPYGWQADFLYSKLIQAVSFIKRGLIAFMLYEKRVLLL